MESSFAWVGRVEGLQSPASCRLLSVSLRLRLPPKACLQLSLTEEEPGLGMVVKFFNT